VTLPTSASSYCCSNSTAATANTTNLFTITVTFSKDEVVAGGQVG
jgi:hypothetical protein